MKARLYYFDKKTRKQDKRSFDRLYRDLDCVSRSNDPSKLLADNALRILSNLIPMLLNSKDKTICINQDFFSDITGKGVDQNSNLLKQLKDIISYKYHRMARFEGKRYNYCYIIEFSEDGEKRASNPKLFYTIDSKINLVRRGKKFGLIAEKIRPSYIDIREIKREKEEEPLGNSSSFSSNTPKVLLARARVRETEIVKISPTSFEETPREEITEIPTLATSSLAELAKVYQTEEIRVEASEVVTNCDELEAQPYGKSVQLESQALTEEKELYQFHKNRESSSGLNLLQDIPLLANLLSPGNESPTVDKLSTTHPEITKKHEEVMRMKERSPIEDDFEDIPSAVDLKNKRNMEFELSGAIFKSFGGVKSDEIMENCKFIPIDENKLGVQLSNGFSLTPTDRDRLKACIRLVYGEGVSIVSSAVLKIAQPKTEILVKPQIQQYHHQWTRFKNDLLNYLPEKTGHHSLNAWFDKFRVSEDPKNNRIILTGSRFYVDSVYNRFQSAIEYVVTKNKVTLELHFENNDEKPIIYKPNGGGR